MTAVTASDAAVEAVDAARSGAALESHDDHVDALRYAVSVIETCPTPTVVWDDIDAQRDTLDQILAAQRPDLGLLELHMSGLLAAALPEVAALEMPGRIGAGGTELHKENLAHTLLVCAQTPARPRVRWAALSHDLGKPATRQITAGKVTFQGHETLGGRLARKMLTRLGHHQIADDVATLVTISGRAHGFDGDWTDSAVRRLRREAGPVFDDLIDLARADCTSRHRHVRDRVADQAAAFARRAGELAARDTEAARRPLLDGAEIMARYGLAPGPQVGQARKLLLDAQAAGRCDTRDQAEAILDAWHAATQPT